MSNWATHLQWGRQRAQQVLHACISALARQALCQFDVVVYNKPTHYLLSLPPPCQLRQNMHFQLPVCYAQRCVLGWMTTHCFCADIIAGATRQVVCNLVRCLWLLKRYRTFAAAGPHLWNSLPVQLRNPDISYGLFRRQLKGHLFSEPWMRRSVNSQMWHLRKTLTYLLTCNRRYNRTWCNWKDNNVGLMLCAVTTWCFTHFRG